MRTPLRAVRSFALAALVALASATCTDQPTEPGGGFAAHVVFAPTFVAGSFAAGLPLDNVTVTVVRPAAETLLVQNAPFAIDDSVLQLDLQVDLLAPSESLDVTLALRSGATELFLGTARILVTGNTPGETPTIPLVYNGPGANIALIYLSPRDTTLSFGDTLTYGATASDSLEGAVANFYIRWSSSAPNTDLRADGRLIAPNVRAKIWVLGVTPTGIADSTSITFTPVPSGLVKSGGDLQNGVAGDTLGLPITVQVMAADALPVQGIVVHFAVASGGGAVVDSVVVSDSLGHASTTVVLGGGLGANSFTATVTGLPVASFGATAGAGAPVAIAKQVGDAQTDTTGRTLPLPLVARVTDAIGNPVAGVAVVWSTVAGSGSPASDTVLTNASGDASVSYSLGGPGIDSVRAQIGGTGAFVIFTATAIAGSIDVVQLFGDAQTDTVAHLLADSLIVETQDAATGDPVGAIPVVFSVVAGSGTLSADTVISDSLGRAAVTLTFGTTSGAVQVSADANRGGGSAVFDLTARADAPHHLAFFVAPPDTLVSGSILVPAPVVEVRDSFENAVHTAGIMIHANTDGTLGSAPPVQMSAPAGLQFTAYIDGGATVSTNALGRATFDSLIVAGDVGDETLHFEEVDLGLGEITHAIYVKAGAPYTVLPALGDAQTAFIDSLVAVAPRVVVTDSFGNVLAGVTVDWVVAAGGGQVTGTPSVTDSNGIAEVGSWQMGPVPGSNALRAVVVGVDSAVFHATAIPLTPTIAIALLNTNVVGVGRTATLQVQLSTPAVGATFISVTSSDPSILTVQSGGATIPDGQSIGSTVLTGVAAGVVDLVASAGGFDPDTLQVTSSLNLITLPTTANVAFGQTASLPVQLALPAPAGGVTVNVTSLDPSKVSVMTPTVTFNVGEQLKNATVSGVAVGTAAVVADNPNFASDTALVSTTAALNITATSLTAFSTFGAQFITEFRSGGSLTPAPTGGILVTLTARDPACVAAPATTMILQGQTSIADSLDYGGSATLPCITYLVASAPGIDADSVQVTINQPPAATLNFTTSEVGSGLQYGSFSVNLAVSAHGGRLVTLRSLDPGVVLVQPDAATAGTDSIGIFVPNGTASVSFWFAGKEGVTSDSGLIVAEVPGFKPDTGKVYVRTAAFDLQGIPATANVFSANSNLYVQMGVANAAYTTMNAYQGPRVGGTMGRVATLTSSPGIVALFKDSTVVEDSSKTVTFPIGQYYTPTSGVNGLQIDPTTAGVTTVAATVPGLIALSTATRTMTVTPPAISYSNTAIEVGAGLQYGAFNVSLSGPVHADTTIILKTVSPGVGLLQLDAATAGTDSIALTILNGVSTASYWIAGVEGIVNDSVLVIATTPGIISDTVKLVVRQPAIDLQGVPASIGSLAANTNIYAQIGIANPAYTSMNAYQGPRVGGTMSRLVSFIIAPGDFALLRDSTATPDSTKTTAIPIGQYYTPTGGLPGIQIDPFSPGTAVVSASLPGFVQLSGAVRTMTVNGPVITLPASAEVGSGLQYGSYSANLGATAHGGVTLVLRTLTPGVGLIQPDGNTVGVDSFSTFIPNGTGSFNFWVAGLEGVVNDSTKIVAEVAGFAPDTMLLRVRTPYYDLQGVPATTTTLSSNNNIYVQMGIANVAGTSMNAYQGSRKGGTAPTFIVRSNAPTVVRIADSATTGDSLSITLPAGQYYSPTSVGTGGLAVDPLTTGSTSIVVTHPVFLPIPGQGTRPITVETPQITVSAGTVGSGLQRNQSFSLGAPQHGGVNVVVKSTAPGIMLVSPNSTTPGTDSIVVFIPNGSTGGSFYIQGMEGQTGSPTVQVSAPGFSDGSAAATVVVPAIDLQGVPASISAGAANANMYAQIGVANAIYTTMNEYQSWRAGGPGPITVTFSNNATGVVQLVTTSLTADIVTALIGTGLYYTPTSVGTGGAGLDPLTVGTATITVSASGFTPLPQAARTVTVTP